jgi:DNA polymerase III subunit epsilon
VYVELLGERQASLVLGAGGATASRNRASAAAAVRGPRSVPLPVRLTEEVVAAHRAFVETLGPQALWKRYFARDEASS